MTHPPPNASDGESLEQRIVRLETLVAFQEDTIHQLSDVVRRQAEHVDLLEQRIKRAESHVRELLAAVESPPLDDGPPPHY